MQQTDVFNGDADGLCALLQLRLSTPKKSQLITGVKRDIDLLRLVNTKPGDEVTVLDISLAKNHDHLIKILNQGARVFYVDPHQPGKIPEHPHLTTLIDTNANTCTSLLVDHYLGGRFEAWAITAAFGDNLTKVASQKAIKANFSKQQIEQLELLGVCLNYNGYGRKMEDLHIAPDRLYQSMLPYAAPFDFIYDQVLLFEQLVTGYHEDLNLANGISAEFSNDKVAYFILPDETWSYRVNGIFANQLANNHPSRAHAIITNNAAGGFAVSVRAPLNNPDGAEKLCALFPTGGGRKAAAGINHIASEGLGLFFKKFKNHFQ